MANNKGEGNLGKIRQGLWDCPSCGHLGISGPLKKCPQCGRTRGANVRFYQAENAPVVVDPEKLAAARAGADWTCKHCGTDNLAGSSMCSECGAEKGTSPDRTTHTYGIPQIPRAGGQEEAVSLSDLVKGKWQEQTPQADDNPVHNYAWEPEKPKRRKEKEKEKNDWAPKVGADPRQLAWIGAILLIICGCIFTLWAVFHTTEVRATVSGFDWSRIVFIDEYRTVREGDWSVPWGGRQVSTEQRIHHYVDVLDHIEYDTEEYQCGTTTEVCGSRDLGNGYFEDVECTEPVMCDRQVAREVYRQDPVYQTWYTYDIERWITYRTIPTVGTNRDDPPPYWGEFTLRCANIAQIGCERENHRTELYVVNFRDSDGTIRRREEDFGDWTSYEMGVEYTLVINSMGIQNDPLRPE